MHSLLSHPQRWLHDIETCKVVGRVEEATGLTIFAVGLPLPIGSMCKIRTSRGDTIQAEMVGIRKNRAVLMALEPPLGISAGDAVENMPGTNQVAVGEGMLGCVLDGLGRRVSGPTFPVEELYPVYAPPTQALQREPIRTALPTGVRVIDALHTLGAGQRIGLFAGTGVGKSVLVGMIARNVKADCKVIALVGERGREVGDFLRNVLGEDGMRNTVVIASTSDQSPVLRVRAAFVATAVAEFLRDRGAEVLLIMDSATRVAMAQRQIGLSAGEPPTSKGYPPSVFDLLPKLMERSGRTQRGSITGVYTVLVEGDDVNEPISDAVRGILDGHLWLSRTLANRGHYPAISPLESISRLMNDVASQAHQDAARDVRRVLAVWSEMEDLVNVGAYVPGVNIEFDVAFACKPRIDAFLTQGVHERSDWDDSVRGMEELGAAIRDARAKRGRN